jgi:hypothetical protein
MNSNVVAGLGNIYANEALFRAGINPTAAGHIDWGIPKTGTSNRRRSILRSKQAAAACVISSIAKAIPAIFNISTGYMGAPGSPAESVAHLSSRSGRTALKLLFHVARNRLK